MQTQPAVKNYFFGKCYSDIFHLLDKTWKRTTSPIVKEWERLKTLFRRNVFAALISLICDLVVFPVISVVILVFNAIFSLLMAIACLLIAAVIFPCYSVVYAVDGLFCFFRGISSHCPTCQKKFLLPSYLCPKCKRMHTELRPSKYGIFHRKCTCGHKLPTTFFNGRQSLEAACAYCGTKLKDGGNHIEISIPVVGGPSAGKTCFISMAISQIEKTASVNGLDFSYSPTVGDDFSANKSAMEHGNVPLKTNDSRLKYYQFYLTPTNVKLKNLISLCDIAGEAYDSNEEIGSQIGYKYANAFLMVLDPLSVRKYREELGDKISLAKYGASKMEMDDILSVLITTLENMKCLTSKNMVKTDVAVVFSKCDIPGLEDKIGSTAVRRYMQQNHIKSTYEATNHVCEQFLTDYEEDNFLNSLRSKFKSVQFFTCSALGHVVNGRPFEPTGVEDPVLWVVDKASASIDLKQKWGKKI